MIVVTLVIPVNEVCTVVGLILGKHQTFIVLTMYLLTIAMAVQELDSFTAGFGPFLTSLCILSIETWC